ncbi:hypothetical protein B0J11DRAFT_36807 [Dendryphion nanum]|uniref:GDP/GTP exchange factor Sec2 N-terminal domain-containing protein n=1 Tax=Dendryphion nanum TaxID=256645 RepID=A0A9P9EJV7_9PLEO|nr:hypothetical protein B0J11DRAFT_36807 [Dendryphion nanum]
MAASLVETATPAPAPSRTTTTTIVKNMSKSTHNCPQCGSAVSLDRSIEEAQRKIAELEAQVEMLKEKATAADKCADYEDQLRTARPQQRLPRTSTSSSLDPSTYPPRPSTSGSSDPPRPSTASSTTAAKQSRFSFLTSRLPSPAPAPPLPTSTTATHTPSGSNTSNTISTELLTELTRERELRAKAEARVQKVDLEIEELSVQLFSQANEMVAAERKARAKLEARVEMLEKKDRDKMARLERLEKAVQRVERVKTLLAAPVGGRGR